MHCIQLLTEVMMENLLPDLQDHFRTNVLATVAALQTSESVSDETPMTTTGDYDTPWSINSAGDALLKCMENLSKPKVCYVCSDKSTLIHALSTPLQLLLLSPLLIFVITPLY